MSPTRSSTTSSARSARAPGLVLCALLLAHVGPVGVAPASAQESLVSATYFTGAVVKAADDDGHALLYATQPGALLTFATAISLDESYYYLGEKALGQLAFADGTAIADISGLPAGAWYVVQGATPEGAWVSIDLDPIEFAAPDAWVPTLDVLLPGVLEEEEAQASVTARVCHVQRPSYQTADKRGSGTTSNSGSASTNGRISATSTASGGARNGMQTSWVGSPVVVGGAQGARYSVSVQLAETGTASARWDRTGSPSGTQDTAGAGAYVGGIVARWTGSKWASIHAANFAGFSSPPSPWSPGPNGGSVSATGTFSFTAVGGQKYAAFLVAASNAGASGASASATGSVSVKLDSITWLC